MTDASPSETLCRYRHATIAYVFVWVLALVVRVIYLWQLRNAPVFAMLLGDAAAYDTWARRIANGDWLGKGVFYQAPLYPYLLGALYTLFGRSLLVARVVQMAIGATSCVLLVRAGRSFFSRNTGILAGIILAMYPTAIFFDCSIQKSVLDLFLVCALLAICGRLLERPDRQWWAVAGIVLGLLALTRENTLVLFPIMLVCMSVSWPHDRWTMKLRWTGLLVAGLAVVLLPVACRNLVVGGEFHLTTAQFGPNFYIGNGKNAIGLYKPLRWGRSNAEFERDDATMMAEQAVGRKVTSAEVSGYWTTKALAEIREDPTRWLRLLGRKWLLVWNVSEVCDSEDQYTYGDWSPLLRGLNQILHFGTLCPLAALGICLTWRQRERLWLLYLMLLGYAASVALFYVFSRYRFPLVPILVLFAAAGLTCLRGAIRQVRWQALLTGVTTVAVVAVFCNHAMVSEAFIRATTHFNIADSLASERSNPREAILEYSEAVRLLPEFAQAHFELGQLLVDQGRTNDAINEYGRALQSRPDYPEAHNGMGEVLAREGKTNEAIMHIEAAARLNPDYPDAHNNLGVLLAKQGRADEAIAQVEAALRLRPDYPQAQYNLVMFLVKQGKTNEAISVVQSALKSEPNSEKLHQLLDALQRPRAPVKTN
jgi:tetratricopeptide (TPR) repeat protein